MAVINSNSSSANNDGRQEVSSVEKMKAKILARDVHKKRQDLLKLGLAEKQITALLAGIDTPEDWQRRQRFIRSVGNQQTADRIQENIRKDRIVERRKHTLGSETKQSLGVKPDPDRIQYDLSHRF